MCLILFAHRVHPDYPLVLVANRDEFYARPTAAAAFWPDADGLLAGRDLRGGGTWLGVTRTGRYAAVTNYREPGRQHADAPSRGDLTTAFLKSTQTPRQYVESLAAQARRYNGFNLLVGDADGLYYLSNRGAGPARLEAGVYGLSNHLLDTPWPKVARGKAALAAAVGEGPPDAERLLDVLADRHPAEDDQLPETGVGLDLERVLSSLFIASPTYGTRASTVLLIGKGGTITFLERTFVDGEPADHQHFSFQRRAAPAAASAT